MPVTKSTFDALNNVSLFTLTSANKRLTVKILDYGATLLSVIVVDRDNIPRDVVLGFDDLDGYQSKILQNPYFGATIGRVANRISNASFALNDQNYALFANNGPNSLHGGQIGLDKLQWTTRDTSNDSLTLERVLNDGEEGYPGAVKVQVKFTVTDNSELKINYLASLEQGPSKTIVNLTNHSYFNLSGAYSNKGNNILDHLGLMKARHYLEIDDNLIPTGTIASVSGTLLDFTESARSIGERVDRVKPNGYDHCYVLQTNVDQFRIDPEEVREAVEVYSPLTGIKLTMSSTEPAFQFYVGSMIVPGHRPKRSQTDDASVKLSAYAGFCLEAQRFPDAINQKQWVKQVILTAEKPYKQTTIYKFEVKEGI